MGYEKTHLSIEQDGIGSGLILQGLSLDTPVTFIKIQLAKRVKMLVKMWYHRKMKLPLYITPLITASPIGVAKGKTIPYIGLIVSRALADFLHTNMEKLNAYITENHSGMSQDSNNSMKK